MGSEELEAVRIDGRINFSWEKLNNEGKNNRMIAGGGSEVKENCSKDVKGLSMCK